MRVSINSTSTNRSDEVNDQGFGRFCNKSQFPLIPLLRIEATMKIGITSKQSYVSINSTSTNRSDRLLSYSSRLCQPTVSINSTSTNRSDEIKFRFERSFLTKVVSINSTSTNRSDKKVQKLKAENDGKRFH